ncbi:MAG: iron-containing alcohol dehydrogenase [Magnetococcales bacterium]|nr:iron-containing alcohol dehydrogenase [Magnetococcales bacterium]
MSSLLSSELRKFVAPEFVFGIGARKQVGQYAHNLGAKRILVVSDAGVKKAGWTDETVDILSQEGFECTQYLDVTPNPKAEEVMNGVNLYNEAQCDAIVVVGGGSPIDCAKGISIVAGNGGKILSYEGVDTVPFPGAPLLCIPTTAGTAADVSQFAIITDSSRRNKIAIITKSIVPDVSLIDPQTTLTMDPFLTACTGLDALTHAVEALVSNAHSPITDLHAIKAIELIAKNIEKVIQTPDDLMVRQNMTLGCLEAGLAFSNASLGAVHAMAHSLGGYLDLPHGECNAILLDHVMAFNFKDAEKQFDHIAKAMDLEVKGFTTQQLRTSITGEVDRLRRSVGVVRSLGELGVHRTDVGELAGKAIQDPCLLTNPRPAIKRDIEVIYEEAL